jgi:CheY-like chemotaxis protein
VTRLLLVEDNLADAILLEEWLELAGLAWEVVHVETFAAATACWEGGGFDALLLDLDIPDGFGLDVLGRALVLAGEVPVVVLSGRQERALATEAVALGARAYVVKGPLSVQNLQVALERQAPL